MSKVTYVAALAVLAGTWTIRAEASPRGAPPAPPAEALKACATLADGAECSFTIDGQEMSGTCRGPKGQALACLPDRGPGGPDGHRGPPQEAIDACASVAEDAACSFSHDGRSLTGTCRTHPEGGKACAPERGPGGPGGHRGPPQEAIDACDGLTSGASCSFSHDGHDLAGTCRGPQDKPLACAPAGPPPRR